MVVDIEIVHDVMTNWYNLSFLLVGVDVIFVCLGFDYTVIMVTCEGRNKMIENGLLIF